MLLGNNVQHYQDQDRLLEFDSGAMQTQGGSVSISNITDGDDVDEKGEEYWFKKSTSAKVLIQTSKKRSLIRVSKMEGDSNDL